MSNTTQSQQQITPQLRQWIIEQSQAGHTAESVLKSMLASGWTEDVAIAAMETTLRGHLEEQALQQGLGPSVPVPDPALDDSPLYIDAGDRRVHVLQNMYNPRVVVFGNLLSDEECDQLIALARPRLARSLTVATKTGGEEVNDDRTSSGMFFQCGENPLVKRLETRIAALVNWPEENGEGLQILHYRPGAEYKPHYDYFDPNEPGTPTILKRGGQRVGTIIMYLGEPEKGGGTTFPDVHLEVAPSTKTLHGGAPVIAGEKWIATKWLRERRFE
jgi:prolyl 4-hydroxylase